MKILATKKIFCKISLLLIAFAMPFFAFATHIPGHVSTQSPNDNDPISTSNTSGSGGQNLDLSLKLENPISVNSLEDFIKKLLDIVLTIGIPIVALAIIYSGFLFVTAGGSEAKLKKAKSTFLYVIIGGAILLGAWVISSALTTTVKELFE